MLENLLNKKTVQNRLYEIQILEELMNLFFFQDKLDVLQAFKLDSEFDKMRSLNGSASYEVRNVNRFFYEKSLSVRDCIGKLFHDELAPLDFKDNPAQSVQQINEWVSNQTKYQIKEILSDSDLSEDSKLVLVSTFSLV